MVSDGAAAIATRTDDHVLETLMAFEPETAEFEDGATTSPMPMTRSMDRLS